MDTPDKTGLYTIKVSSSNDLKKSIHLEKRFKNNVKKRNLNNKQAVEIKREAILEERRYRLNQNFQKVKRIAKEMKDRQENKLNLLSQSMALAESNRNRHIEKRRTTSKQVVERAKSIALQNQYRSQQEQERRKAELESRFEKTEQRRLALLNQKQEKQKKKVKKPIIVVQVVQEEEEQEPVKKKKPSSWSIILKAFRELGLPLPSSTDTWLEFNALGKLLNQAKVIVVTTKVLNTALKMIDEESRQRARVLLTSYMTLMCPKEVLQDVEGVEEKRLHASAKQMLTLFETWLGAHGRPGATAARLGFVQAWNEYTVLFDTWKSRDCDHLVKNMIAYYVELSTLRQTMIAQQNDISVGDQLQQQLDSIKPRLEKLGGPQALADLQKALESSAASTSTGRKKQEQNNKPRTPELDREFESQQTQQHSNVNGEQLGQLLNGYVPQSEFFSNDQLAHELIMDPEFKLKKRQLIELEKQVQLMAEKAFFDKIAQDIEQGTPELSVPSLIRDVKIRLLSLVRPGTSMYKNIDETMDLELVQQQMNQKSFDIQHMMNYVIQMMSTMCAPVRDIEIQALKRMNLIDQIQKTLKLLEEMSLDLSNFRLRSLRPHLMTMAVEYEREKFAHMIHTGEIQLVRTETWLNTSASKLCQVAAQRNPEGIDIQKPTHDAIFEDAFISLLISNTQQQQQQELPETLRLDTHRILDYQNEVQAITIVAALLMLAKNFGFFSSNNNNNNNNVTELGNKLFTMLSFSDISIDHLSAEIEKNVKDDYRKEMIRAMVEKTVSHSDTIYSLISRRVALVLKSTIQNNTFVTDAVLTSNGLYHVRSHLQSLAHKVLRLSLHHRKVYSRYYDDIIHKALL